MSSAWILQYLFIVIQEPYICMDRYWHVLVSKKHLLQEHTKYQWYALIFDESVHFLNLENNRAPALPFTSYLKKRILKVRIKNKNWREMFNLKRKR